MNGQTKSGKRRLVWVPLPPSKKLNGKSLEAIIKQQLVNPKPSLVAPHLQPILLQPAQQARAQKIRNALTKERGMSYILKKHFPEYHLLQKNSRIHHSMKRNMCMMDPKSLVAAEGVLSYIISNDKKTRYLSRRKYSKVIGTYECLGILSLICGVDRLWDAWEYEHGPTVNHKSTTGHQLQIARTFEVARKIFGRLKDMTSKNTNTNKFKKYEDLEYFAWKAQYFGINHDNLKNAGKSRGITHEQVHTNSTAYIKALNTNIRNYLFKNLKVKYRNTNNFYKNGISHTYYFELIELITQIEQNVRNQNRLQLTNQNFHNLGQQWL